MSKKNVEHLFEKMNEANVLVVGDIMLDAYIWGKVNRISPEAPVPVVEIVNREYKLGGAANVALNLNSLGVKVWVSGAIGNDEHGKKLVEIFKNQNIDTSGILIDETRPTTIKHRIISGSQHLLRIDDESTTPLSKENTEKAIEQIKNIIQLHPIDAIIFQDYDKGYITPALIKEITTFAAQRNIFTAVDPKKRNFLHYQNVDLFKPNKKELFEGLHISPSNNMKDIKHAIEVLKNKTQAKNILVTLSAMGILLLDDQEKLYHVPAVERKIADVSGAGDTVISISAIAMALGMDAYTASILGNLAGGIVCEHPGVVAIDKDTLLEEYQIRYS